MHSLSDLHRQLEQLEAEDLRSQASTYASVRPLKSIPTGSRARTSTGRSVASSSSVATEKRGDAKPSTYNYTLADVEEGAVLSAAYRAVNSDCRKTADGLRYGVCRILVGNPTGKARLQSLKADADMTMTGSTTTLSGEESVPTDAEPSPIPQILLLTARRIASLLLLSPHLYLLAPSDTRGGWNGVVILSSDAGTLERAVEGLRARFGRRLKGGLRPGPEGFREDRTRVWTGWIDGLDGWGLEDEEAIWALLSRATVTDKKEEITKPAPPPGSRGIEEMVKRARRKFVGLTPQEAWEELQQPLTPEGQGGNQLGSTNKITKARYLIDIRSSDDRRSHGRIPNAFPIELAKLELSLDPRLTLEEGRKSLAMDYDVRYILISEDGRASSLAVLRLMEMGLWNVTDVVGGFKSWRANGLSFYN